MTNRPGEPRRRITIERTYQAPVEDLWDLWTTKEGIESWWGPEGFTVQVRSIDLRPGGEMHYAMIASAPAQIDFMKKAGMPPSTEHRVTYTEITPQKRIAYTTMADFIPGVDPYEMETTVEFNAGPLDVKMVLTIDAMHDEKWTKMAVMGWESELGKLAKALAA